LQKQITIAVRQSTVISFGNPENVYIFGREGQDPPLQNGLFFNLKQRVKLEFAISSMAINDKPLFGNAIPKGGCFL
jgi:hypothetical protein